jgi:hypothetical protein
MNLDDYLSLFPAYTRGMPRFIALAEAVLRQATDLMDLVPQLASGFSFAHAEGVQLDALGGSVGIIRQEGRDDESYRRVLLKKLKLFTWDGTNERAFDFAEEGETFVDNDDGTVTARTDVPLPASEVLPVPVGIRVV